MSGNSSNRRGGLALRSLCVLAVASLAAALAVRAIPPAAASIPEDMVEETPRLAEPMQLLGRGGGFRVHELDRWVSPTRREGFEKNRQILFSLQGCPPLVEWIDGPEGQWSERQLTEMRAGTREDALAALVLIFQIARATEWWPGVLARTQHAERLGGLLQDWLRTWGQNAARDPLLSEPALAAAVLYGRVMRTAWNAPLLTRNDAPYERATAFLSDLTGISSGRRTRFGEALASRFGRAAESLAGKNHRLDGFEEEAGALFPGLVGDCE